METVFKGRVFSVESGRRRFPNGQEHEVDIVRHSESVVLIPIEDDGRVVIDSTTTEKTRPSNTFLI